MEIHYNAFISYRHHPDDIRVASEIHRGLERFRVPGSIRKKTGKISRLFRDKEELPITSNLTDDISSALRNSDYLIVICSVHTKESIWVQREIELFLQTHHRSRVLTVLASGEPYDVIPESLLYEDVTDPVTGETRRMPIEPLSCDWRGKRRQARQNELPRLAAALLGCGYDELRQRQKQYKARRNMAIITASLVASLSLAAYFLYTSITIQKANEQIQAANEQLQDANEEIQAANVQIKANLDEALINQSRHLATAAQERLEDGDRLTAISLAVAALPGEGNERPYVSEAENVLISALGLYSTVNELKAVGTVGPGSSIDIRQFWVTASEKVIYIYDQRDIVTAWDTQTLQQLGEFDLSGGYFGKVVTLPSDNVLALAGAYGDTLYCYQPDGTLLWQWEGCSDVILLPDENSLLMIHQTGLTSGELLRIDPVTGKAIGGGLELKLPDSTLSPSNFLTNSIPEGMPALIRYYDYGRSEFYMVDLQTGEHRLLSLETSYPAETVMTRDGKILMLGDASGLGLAGTFEGNRVTTPEVRKIYCYDIESGGLLWENEIAASVRGVRTLEEIPGSGRVLCQNGNVFMILDQQTGETVSRCEAGSGALAVSVGERCASAVLHDGYVCYYWYDANYCYEVKCMKNNVDLAAVGVGCYSLHLYGDQVTVYQTVTGKPAWEALFDGSFTATEQKVCGQYLARQDYSSLYLFDTDSKALVWKTDNSQAQLLGFSSDGTALWYADGTESLVVVDTATGRSVTKEISLSGEGSGAYIAGELFFADDCLHYVVKGIDTPKLVSWDQNTNEKQAWALDLGTGEETAYWSWQVLARGERHLWLWAQEAVLLELDMESGGIRCIAEQTTQRPVIALGQDGGKLAIADQGGISLGVPGQSEMTFLALDGVTAGSLCFFEDQLLALCDNGVIYRFDASGKNLSQTKLSVDYSFGEALLKYSADPSEITWHFTKDNRLVVNALGEGNVIDCESWNTVASISYFLTYNEKDNCLVCSLTSGVAGYPIYQTAQLLEMAEQELNGFQLTPEQKASYGID